jgi:hypothetical protein
LLSLLTLTLLALLALLALALLSLPSLTLLILALLLPRLALLSLLPLLSALALLRAGLILAIAHTVVDRRQTAHQVACLVERLLLVSLAVACRRRIRAVEASAERIQVVRDRLLPVPYVVSGPLPHNAARELDLVAQASFAHSPSRLTKIACCLGTLASEITRHPVNVFLQLLDFSRHFRLALIQTLLAFGPCRAGIPEILHVASDVTLLIRQFLRATRGVLDPTRLSRLARLLEQASCVLDLVERGAR